MTGKQKWPLLFGIVNGQNTRTDHLAVFAVDFEVGITAINLLKIANQGAEGIV